MVSAETVANYFIDKAEATGRSDLTPMKLLKLVYYAHGWHLGLWNMPLIEEKIEAWEYGPVVRELYLEFKEFGDHPITRKARQVRIDEQGLKVVTPDIREVAPPQVREDVVPFLDRVWDVYSEYTGIQLSNLTHQAGTPWHQVATTVGDNLGHGYFQIPNKLIQDYFAAEAARDDAA